MDDLHQLDLVELVLADHAARVLAVGAGLAAEARGVADELERQPLERDDLVANDIGDGDLGGRDQVELLRILARHREQVVLELRQVAGAAQARGVHQVRRIHLGVAVLARVHVEHELPQRPVQSCHRPGHEREARAGDLAGAREIEQAQPLAHVHMVLDREVEAPRLADSPHLQVVVGRLAHRHRFVREVGDDEQEVGELLLDLLELLLEPLELVRKRGRLGHQRGRVLALALGLAHLLGDDVAAVLQLLGARLHLLARGLQALELLGGRGHAARGQALRHAFQVASEQLDV